MESNVFVLFGATGDLAKRKLFPAIYNLHLEGKLSEKFAVVGVGRSQMTNDEFKVSVSNSLKEFSRNKPNSSAELDSFIDKFSYYPMDVTKEEDYTSLYESVQAIEQKYDIPQNRTFYLSVSPDFFEAIALNIKKSGLGTVSGWKRLVIEKPFGHDLESARKLNETLSHAFEENEIYRIDHYLGKEMVQNIEVMRFGNSIFEPLWNNNHIASVQIIASETVGVEERASYYDHSGALRDMFQNHMLQMLMMVAMEPPSSLNTEAIRNEKVKVLQSLRTYSEEAVNKHIILGQYAEGQMKGSYVPGYLSEHGVSPDSKTPTFVGARLFVDNFRWSGVPFYIKTGKRLPAKTTKIIIQFKDMPKHLYFNQKGDLLPNLLVIQVNPSEGVTVKLNLKNPQKEEAISAVDVDFLENAQDIPEAYERLIFDAMRGDSTFFTRWDEVELAWKWIDLVLKVAESTAPLYSYRAGSEGPEAVNALLREDGFKWW